MKIYNIGNFSMQSLRQVSVSFMRAIDTKIALVAVAIFASICLGLYFVWQNWKTSGSPYAKDQDTLKKQKMESYKQNSDLRLNETEKPHNQQGQFSAPQNPSMVSDDQAKLTYQTNALPIPAQLIVPEITNKEILSTLKYWECLQLFNALYDKKFLDPEADKNDIESIEKFSVYVTNNPTKIKVYYNDTKGLSDLGKEEYKATQGCWFADSRYYDYGSDRGGEILISEAFVNQFKEIQKAGDKAELKKLMKELMIAAKSALTFYEKK